MSAGRGFTAIPNHILRDTTIPPSTRLLYGVIASYAWGQRSCTASSARLCEEAGIGRSAFFEGIAMLRERGLLEVQKRKSPNGWRNVYVPAMKGVAIEDEHDAEAEGRPDSGRGVVRYTDEGSSAMRTQKKTKSEEDSEADASERVCAKLKIAGKAVKAETWARTVGALEEFNQQSGKNMLPVTGTGQPSEAAKRIYGRLAAWPNLSDAEVADVIRRTLSSRWWGSDPPSVGVVFGPKVFEENLSRSPAPRAGAFNGNGNHGPKDGSLLRAINQAIAADEQAAGLADVHQLPRRTA